MSAANLEAIKFPEPNWIIPDIMPEGLTLLAGKPKLGKSWLCLSLGIAKACGGVALGTIQVAHSEVLYLCLEDPARRLQGRLHIQMALGEPWPAELTFDTMESCHRWAMSNGGLWRSSPNEMHPQYAA